MTTPDNDSAAALVSADILNPIEAALIIATSYTKNTVYADTVEFANEAFAALATRLREMEADATRLRAFVEDLTTPDRNLSYDVETVRDIRQSARDLLGLENDPQTGKVKRSPTQSKTATDT